MKRISVWLFLVFLSSFFSGSAQAERHPTGWHPTRARAVLHFNDDLWGVERRVSLVGANIMAEDEIPVHAFLGLGFESGDIGRKWWDFEPAVGWDFKWKGLALSMKVQHTDFSKKRWFKYHFVYEPKDRLGYYFFQSQWNLLQQPSNAYTQTLHTFAVGWEVEGWSAEELGYWSHGIGPNCFFKFRTHKAKDGYITARVAVHIRELHDELDLELSLAIEVFNR